VGGLRREQEEDSQNHLFLLLVVTTTSLYPTQEKLLEILLQKSGFLSENDTDLVLK